MGVDVPIYGHTHKPSGWAAVADVEGSFGKLLMNSINNRRNFFR